VYQKETLEFRQAFQVKADVAALFSGLAYNKMEQAAVASAFNVIDVLYALVGSKLVVPERI